MAVASPIPDDAPVTSATFPSSFPSICDSPLPMDESVGFKSAGAREGGRVRPKDRSRLLNYRCVHPAKNQSRGFVLVTLPILREGLRPRAPPYVKSRAPR